MTPQEAITTLKREYLGDSEFMELAKQMGANALRKQIPTKVTHEASLYKCCTCPNCKNVVDKFEKWGERAVRITYKYCHCCGQNLDWLDETRTPQNDAVRK